MKKTLRLFLLALLAMVTNGALAQDILWSEDFSSYSKSDVPSGGVNNYVCSGSGTKIYEEKLAGGVSPELLINPSSSGGSFTATIALNGKSGDMVLAFKSNRTDLKVSISDNDVVIGENGGTGNDYSYPITIPAGKESITVTFAGGSKNARFDNAKLYQGTAKKPAGLSWGTASREVTIGSADNKFPVLTNANNLPVTYTSSNESVATIATDGTITLISAGKSDITATFVGNDEYESAEVTYALTVKSASTVDISNTPETAYTVVKANELIEAGEGLDAEVYVRGIISGVKSIDTGQYGNAEYTISDDGTTTSTQLVVYRGYYLNKEKFTSENQIGVGDVVVVCGKLVDYSGTYEFTSGNYIYSIVPASAIDNITTDTINENAPVYNLAGQRVSKDTKGILIQNGKKFVNNK